MNILPISKAFRFRKKSEFALTLVLLLLVGCVISSSYFYVYNAANSVLVSKLSSIPIDAKIENYRLNISGTISMVHQKNITQYIVSKYKGIITNINNFTESHGEIFFRVYYDSRYSITRRYTTSFFSIDEQDLSLDLRNLFVFDIPPSKLNESDVLIRLNSAFTRSYSFDIEKAIGTKIKLTVILSNNTKRSFMLRVVGFYAFKLERQNSNFIIESFSEILVSPLFLSKIYPYLGDAKDAILLSFDKRYIRFENVDYYQQKYKAFAIDVARKFKPYVRVKLPIIDTIMKFKEWYTFQFLNYFAYILPVLLIGWIVLKFEYELTGMRRRLTIATLKTRGFSNSEILLTSIFEAIVNSIIVVIPALILGNLSSIYYLQLQGISTPVDVNNLAGIVELSFSNPFYLTVLLAMLLAINIFALVPMVLKTLTHEVAEAKTYTAMGFENIEFPTTEKVLLVIFLPISFYILFILDLMSQLFFFMIILIYIFLISNMLVKLFAKALVGAYSELIDILSRIIKTASTKLISISLKRQAKITGYTLVILSLTLSFSLAVTTTQATILNHVHDLSYYYAGSDISFRISDDFRNETAQILQEVIDMTSVQNATLIRIITGQIYFVFENKAGKEYSLLTDIKIIAIDKSFLSVAYLEPYFLKESQVKSIIFDNKSALASSDLSWSFSRCKRYTPYIINSKNRYVRLNASVTDYFEYFPRIRFMNSSSFLIVNASHLRSFSFKETTNYIFIKTKKNINVTSVANEILQKFKDKITEIHVAEVTREAILSRKDNVILFGFFIQMSFYMVIFLSLGIIVISINKIKRYRKEYAILRALGFTEKQFIIYFSLDMFLPFIVSLLAALVIALIAGLYVATPEFMLRYLDLSTLIGESSFFGQEVSAIYYYENILPVECTIPLATWIQIIGIIALSILTSIMLMLLAVKKLNISQELKFEFG